MKGFMKAGTFFLWILFFTHSLFSEGPLLQKNQYYTNFLFQNYQTEEVFNNHGAVCNNYNPFLQNKYVLEADLGLSNRDTLSQMIGFTKVSEVLDGSTQGVTDYAFILKHALVQRKECLLSLEGSLNLPLFGDYKPAVRYGNFGIGLMLFFAVQKKINSYPLLLSFGGGGFHFHKPIEDFLKFYFRSTLCVTSVFSLRTTFRLDYGLNNGKRLIEESLVDFNPRARFLRGDFEVIIKPVPCMELTSGYFHFFWGRNVGHGGGFFCRVAFFF